MDCLVIVIKIILLCDLCCCSCMYPFDSDYKAVRAEEREQRRKREQKRLEKEQKKYINLMVFMMMERKYDPDTALGLGQTITSFL